MPDPSNPSKSPRTGFTRRGFLRGAGLTAVAAVAESQLADAARAAEAANAQERLGSKVVGPGPVNLSLTINGQARQVSVEPRATLADVLRTSLDLTGTKVVCDRGACSACTVFLDNVPVCSCMTLAIDVGDRPITTIEGLARGGAAEGELHPIQSEFIAKDAMQCGFCTPGMLMSCAALLNHNTNPTLDDVRHAVRGNLCRCGTYPKVFEATLAAAEILRKSNGKGA